MSAAPARTPRVALLAPCYWPEVHRGAERIMRELADGLVEDGYEPTLVTSHRGMPSSTMEDGLKVIRLPRPPEGQLRRRMFEDYMAHAPLSALALRTGGFDIAQALYPTDGAVAARWSRATGRPSIFSYMGIPDRHWLTSRRMRLKLTLEAARDCDVVTALSRVVADEFHNTLGIEARVIPPGVDTETFRPGPERTEAPTIFCAAAVDAKAKKVDQLVRAFALVRARRPEARLLLCRPPDPADEKRVAGDQEGVEWFADVDDRDALARTYGSAWITALPSVGEAFGLVLVESLACGTPVVGRRAGAIPEVLDRDSIGVVFEGSEEELATALLECLELSEDPGTAAACRARAEDFSTRKTTEAYERLYTELLER